MTGEGVPERSHQAAAVALTANPPMPAMYSHELSLGSPFFLNTDSRYGIGWEGRDASKGGTCFVVARRSAMGTMKVIERFGPTHDGWSQAWGALVRYDADAARGLLPGLAARAVADRARVGITRLDADSLCYLRSVIFLGGYAEGVELVAGKPYDVRFLNDHLAVFPCRLVDALLKVPYTHVETIDIGGPGLVKKWSPGQQAGITWLLGLPGAVLATSQTKIQTIVRIHTPASELFFLNTTMQADGLRIQLSLPLKAIRDARSAPPGTPELPARSQAPESVTDQLIKLAAMLESGLLTRDEFDHLKAKLIAQS